MLSFWESKLSQTFSYCSLKLTFSVYDFIDSGARVEESEKQGVEWNDDASGSQGETKAKFSSDQLPYKWHQTKINKFPKTASYLTNNSCHFKLQSSLKFKSSLIIPGSFAHQLAKLNRCISSGFRSLQSIFFNKVSNDLDPPPRNFSFSES